MMERNSKLEAARRLRGWTLEMASQKIGVHPRTLRRWETGKSKPHGFRIYKISEVYEMTPSALGIGSERHQWFMPSDTMPSSDEHFLLTRVVEPLMTIDDLDLHLMGLILQRKLDRKNLDYLSFQQQIHQCIHEYDSGLREKQAAPVADPVRVQALRVVASIPIASFLDDLIQRSLSAPPVEILTHCASAITACWHMDLQRDAALLRQFVSGYIILLSELFTRADHCRRAAAELISQACLLRTILAMRLEETRIGVRYYTRALDFSQFAVQHPDVALHSGSLASYGCQPEQTLQKMAESLWLIKPSPQPPDFSLVRNYIQMLTSSFLSSQRYEEEFSELTRSSELFAAHSFASPGASTYVEAALSVWPGVLYHELDTYAQVLDNVEGNGSHEPICDASEQVRVEFLENRALAALRLHDMDQGVTTLRAAIPQALSMGSEQELVEAGAAYHTLQFLIPGAALPTAKALKDLFRIHD